MWNPLFKGAINVLAADADYSVAVDMMQLTGLPMFWGDSCFPGATNCTGIGGPVMGPKGCLANGGCWEMADNWEAAVDAEAAQLKPLIENGTVVGIFVGDEMVCNGLPFHDFQKLVTKIRAATAALPSLICMVDPPLKPYQPNQSSTTPAAESTRLCDCRRPR